MQEAFRPFAQCVVPGINAMTTFARQQGMPVVFTQHGHHNPEEEEQTNVLVSYLGAEESIRYGSKSWQMLPEINVRPGDIRIEKDRYDAFAGTDLDTQLRQLDVDGLIIAGVCTNLCCESTARSGFARNYGIIFLSDACSTYTRTMHEATLNNIRIGFGETLPVPQVIKRLETSGRDAFPIRRPDAAKPVHGGRPS